ncbi:MAG: hypothetical protein NC453_20460 [Muribaculum sp.]|nr:hypothetical protein [Muribaculum sp.]
MNVLSETGGQTCNQFWQYLYYLKKAYQSRKPIYVQLPDKTIEDYPNLLYNQYIKFPFYSKLLTRRLGIKKSIEISRKFTVIFLNNYIRFILHQISFHKINFYSGKPTWSLKDISYKPILPLLRHLFTPKKIISNSVDIEFKRQSDRNAKCMFIGVHMRGGDYRKWRNGKYFYTQDQYRAFLDKILSLHPNKDIIFFIASNEQICPDVFKGLKWFQIPNASPTHDLYALSKCELIIGTLSSFNSWVSLVWERPLYTITDPSSFRTLTQNDFSVVLNYDHKENGWKFPRDEDFFFKLSHPWLYRHSNNEYRLNGLKKHL